MGLFARTFSIWTMALLATGPAIGQTQGPPVDIAHMREELGVNAFTAPSIGVLIEELQALQPIPFEKVWRKLPEGVAGERPRLALCAGQLIADGFLVVAAEKQSRVEPVARALLKVGKALGVAQQLNKHSKSLLELAARNDWSGMKTELVRAQADAEAAMIALKDEEIAHLVSLGGWLRGLEITSSIVLDEFNAEHAKRLLQPALLNYFIERVATLNPALRKQPRFATIDRTLRSVQTITSRGTLSQSDVEEIRSLARAVNAAIASAEAR